MNRIILFVVACFCLVLCSCNITHYLPKPKNIPYSVNGAHVVISVPQMEDTYGELIAITDDSIYVHTINHHQGFMVSTAKSSVKHMMIEVSLTSDNPEAINTWGSLLWLTCITHGLYALISLPINLAVGLSIAASAAQSTYSTNYPEQIKWEEIKKFARFPQGIPSGIKLAEIK